MKKLVPLVLLLLPLISFSQKHEVGLGGGIAVFKGDINPRMNFKEKSPAFLATYKYHYHHHFAIRTSFSYGKLQGADSRDESLSYEDEKNRLRNLSFKTNFWELGLGHEFYLLDKSHKNDISAYLFGGIGLLHFNPKAQYNGTWYELRDLGTEGQGQPGYKDKYSRMTWTASLGGGIKYQVTKEISFGFELNYKFTGSDYIDDVSGDYADAGKIAAANGTTAAYLSDRSYEGITTYNAAISPGHHTDANGYKHVNGYGSPGDKRGTFKGNDRFLMLTVGVAYVFNSKPVHIFMDDMPNY